MVNEILERVGDELERVGGADPKLLVVAGLAFAVALFCDARAWRAGLAARGKTVCTHQCVARYAVGSLVNAVAPARAGTIARLALFAKAAGGTATATTAAAVGATRILFVGGLALVGLGPSVLPIPSELLLPIGLGAAIAAFLLRRRLGCLRVAGWVGGSTALRLGAAAVIAAAFGVGNPLVGACAMLAALGLAGVLPLTPGNAGVGAAAVAFALSGYGVGGATGMTVGVAFGLVETAVAVVLGAAGGIVLLAGKRDTSPIEIVEPLLTAAPVPVPAPAVAPTR